MILAPTIEGALALIGLFTVLRWTVKATRKFNRARKPTNGETK